MKIIKILLLGFLFLPVLFRLDTLQEKTDKVFLLNQEKSVGQTFIASFDNIYSIEVFANNPKLLYESPLLFKLKKQRGDLKDIVTIPFGGKNIGTNFWLRLRFNPIADSRNKTYYFEISTVEATSSGNLEISYSSQDTYPYGNLFINEQKSDGDLTFRVYYKTSILKFISDSTFDFVDRLRKDQQFVVFYSLLLVATSLFLVYSLTRLND